MQVKEIMTKTIVSVAPGASVPEVAALLLRERISAVPVLEDGTLVGVISEADLMHRHEIGTERDPAARPWWVRLFAGEQSPASYVESHAVKVRDIMTTAVVSVSEDMPVAEVASVFESRNIRRVPVVSAGKVIGMVSRADLVRALATYARSPDPKRQASDAAIHSALLAELESQPWWHPIQSHLSVNDGIVHFYGLMESADEGDASRVAAENVPGVQGIEDHRVNAAGSQWAYW